MKHIKNFKLNENNFSDVEFEKAKQNIKELSEYFEMDETTLMEIIWNEFNKELYDTPDPDITSDKISSMAYSFGLI